MKVPPSLDLKDWWRKAACLGKPIDLLTKRDCYGCPVQWECLWIAITDDDRLGDHPLFIRGGLPANKRERLWWKHDRDPHLVFIACQVEAKEGAIGKRKRRKTKANT